MCPAPTVAACRCPADAAACGTEIGKIAMVNASRATMMVPISRKGKSLLSVRIGCVPGNDGLNKSGGRMAVTPSLENRFGRIAGLPQGAQEGGLEARGDDAERAGRDISLTRTAGRCRAGPGPQSPGSLRTSGRARGKMHGRDLDSLWSLSFWTLPSWQGQVPCALGANQVGHGTEPYHTPTVFRAEQAVMAGAPHQCEIPIVGGRDLKVAHPLTAGMR